MLAHRTAHFRQLGCSKTLPSEAMPCPTALESGLRSSRIAFTGRGDPTVMFAFSRKSTCGSIAENFFDRQVRRVLNRKRVRSIGCKVDQGLAFPFPKMPTH